MKPEQFNNLKPGDKVKIRSNLIAYRDYGGITTVTPMEKYFGKQVTISVITKCIRGYVDSFNIVGDVWHFTMEMIDDNFKYGK